MSEIPDLNAGADPPPLERAVSFTNVQKYKEIPTAPAPVAPDTPQTPSTNLPNTPGISSKKKLFDSLFPKWELSLYPSGLTKAIAIVEKHDFIRSELHRLETKDESDSLNSSRNHGKSSKQKGMYQMRMMGLERLPISELNEMKDSHVCKSKTFLTNAYHDNVV